MTDTTDIILAFGIGVGVGVGIGIGVAGFTITKERVTKSYVSRRDVEEVEV